MEKHYKSDFALSVELRDREGNPLGVPTWPFKVEVYTNGAKKVVAECKIEPKGDGGYEMVCTDNLVLGDPIVVSANNHGLMPGRVKMLIYNNTPNALYEDGYEQNTIFVETDLELTATPSDVSEEDTQVSVEAVLPFAVVTAYDMAVRNGYRGTQEEWEAALRDLPFVASNANDKANAAETAASNANDKANAAETAASNANEAAGRAEAAQALANGKAAEAGEAARLATSAASSAGQTIGRVETKMQAINREWGERSVEIERATAECQTATANATQAATEAGQAASDAATKATLANAAALRANAAADKMDFAVSVDPVTGRVVLAYDSDSGVSDFDVDPQTGKLKIIYDI